MKYALLIYGDQSQWADLSEEDKAKLRAEEMPRWIAVMEQLATADPKLDGYELDERGTAKVVRVRDGERIVTDGHAPGEYRADTVRNLDAWYAAFDVKEGDANYVKPEDRVRIW